MAVKFPARGEALAYGEPYYWEARYDAERALHGAHHHFEWYCTLEDLWPILQTYVGPETLRDDTARLLVVGCGTSKVAEDCHSRGLRNVLSIDVSKTVVNFMQARYEGTAGLAFSQMDVRKMDRLADSCMELVIDKACMDSLFCSGGSYTDVLRMNQEICRVLVPGRHFVSVTLGSPASRLPHLQHQSLLWRVDHCPLRGEGLHGLHVYVCTKSVTLNALQRRISNHKGDVAVGQVFEKQDAEWDARKYLSSSTTFKDQFTTGHVRLMRVRDADAVLRALAESESDDDATAESKDGSGDKDASG
ncbi:hypothetical protein M885DRAFT_508072 [Pelagophyceae sp. CCMP2097]|nr:hypothetical protein M885DRAFT_508072 [Pelagophyceae sp. CCMP2097]